MNILAIDTSALNCSVTLHIGAGAWYTRVEDASREHSRLVLQMIGDVTREAGIELADLNGLAWNAGPGSFTGLRIGASVIQAIAYGARLPVLSLSSTEILAHAVLSTLPAHSCGNDTIAIAIDARMNGVYWATYRNESGQLEQVEPDQLLPLDDVPGHLHAEESYLLAGDAWQVTSLAEQGHLSVIAHSSANDVMALALRKPETEWSRELVTVVPRYIRGATHWQKRKLRPGL